TGYVGSHSIAALVAAGHRVRVLARSPERIPAALAPLGVGDVETAIGAVTDPAAVERALRACDAHLHAASGFSRGAGTAERLRADAVRGPEMVRAGARGRGRAARGFGGCEPALLPPAAGAVLTVDSPVGQTRWAYSRSKADSELVARRHQAMGAPV